MCRWVFFVCAAIYAVAVALFLVGTFGLFGAETDPLAGIFLIPLGLPWNVLTEYFPDRFAPWLGVGAPLINLAIIRIVCRLRR